MKYLGHVCTALVAALVVLVPVAQRLPSVSRHYGLIELAHEREAVAKRLADVSAGIEAQLDSVGAAIARDRDFSLKLLVEKDASAPEVAQIAGRYMSPMGFSLLDITDSSFAVLSSGHFAARAGMPAGDKAQLLSSSPTFVFDYVKGDSLLTLQAKTRFSCADIPFYCMGGVAIDADFLARLAPRAGVRVLLQQGGTVRGMDGVTTMSAITDGAVTVNSTQYLAADISLAVVPADTSSVKLLILMEKPPRASLRMLF